MSDNHIRGISTTLSLLDEGLCEFEQWARGHEVTSVLYEVRNTLSAVQRQLIAQRVAKMRVMLKEIRDTLNLEGAVHRVDKMIAGSCAVLWVSVVELESDHLRRYGQLPHGLAEYLDPKVAVLNEDLQHISQIAKQAAPS
ncbi:MAG: hypothetical protein ACLP5H_14345 [Desulfomonilaceae bacterium]